LGRKWRFGEKGGVSVTVKGTSLRGTASFDVFCINVHGGVLAVGWIKNLQKLEMWANAQRDGRPAEYRWHPLFNVAKFG